MKSFSTCASALSRACASPNFRTGVYSKCYGIELVTVVADDVLLSTTEDLVCANPDKLLELEYTDWFINNIL